jgi:hypothetical protein
MDPGPFRGDLRRGGLTTQAAVRRWRQLLIASSLIAQVAVASTPVWREVARDDDGNRYFLDTASIDRNGEDVAALVRTDFARPRKAPTTGDAVFAHIDALIIDCAQLASAIETRTLRLANGDEVVLPSNAREELRFYRAQPGSISERVLSAICGTRRR